ncbi:structural maintenance of chromosomes protein 1A [Monomorium pharaonis]|uniref:structural maintenance of chromosomes protein 1A n=1 Tax=Monomorium pharaonis TaxID=307658 RepID=UPI00102E18F7|nr:structural maintenance of chromosomes protein 1A [Monomorium pharaonis]
MLTLNTIVISNFKSFGGEMKITHIQPFTAIIGPNGSGKSNIMDAISFALGEKTTALRVKRLSELVYGYSFGQSMTEELTYVKVKFSIDGIEEKSFTRTIHDETSRYKIDNENVTEKFYLTELRKMGLDVKAGNFLIPQGYIECFAMKMPKDLTAMFETTSNSITYKANYERLKSELLKVEEEVHFEHQMMKQAKMKKKYAITEKAETEKYLQLKEEYNKKKLIYQSIRLILIKKEVESLQDEKQIIRSNIDKYQCDKKVALHLLKRTTSQCKSLSNTLEGIEEKILEMEDITQKKKAEHIVLEENLSYWQKKHDCARVSLNSASKAYSTKQRIIQELKDELKQIDHKLIELRKASQTSIIELNDSQIKRYMELMSKAEYQAKNFVKQINSLLHDQQEDHNKLDNENRRKQELEDKLKQISLRKENFEKRLKKLQDSSVECKAMFIEKEAKIQELNKKIPETITKLSNLEIDISKIREELSEVLSEADNDNKNETIKKLKQFYSIVVLFLLTIYNRLFNLCKPIHPRYNVAITKGFGKSADAIVVDTKRTAIQCIQFLKEQKIRTETFLPLDSIKTVCLKEQLRAVKEPKNVKLLYDVLDISLSEISKAILFVTKNTLVCDNAEDARKIAYELDDKRYDCISLDGCFYCTNGTMSGGQLDLTEKAKQWEKNQVLTLENRKAQLMQELKELPNISLMQSELSVTKTQIEGFKVKNKYIEIDIKDTEKMIVKMQEELNTLDRKIIELNMAIDEIQDIMQKRDEEIKNTKKHINAIKDAIFVDFCKDINVPDISYYEENNLRIYREQKERQIELEEQYNRIENQLCFENESNTESKVLKWQCAVEQAVAKLNEVHQKERKAKIELEQEETKISTLKNDYATVEKDLKTVEEKLDNYRSQIGNIETLYLNKQKEYIAVQKKIEHRKIDCKTILKECKMEDIIIPISLISHRESRESTSSSSLTVESFGDCKVLSEIDFSQFPSNIRNCTEEDLQETIIQLNEQLIKIQDELAAVTNANLKVDEKINSIAQEIQQINTNLQKFRKNYDQIKAEFESVKAKRYKLFLDCLESVIAEIDSIYKNLVNDMSAQAIILPDNLEEPYAGKMIYNCIMPSKTFHTMQYLSGGEKSLASLALLIAIQRYKKIPFLIMDEGDAALDKINIKNVIRFIQSQVNTMQFITISLHKEMFSNANALIGVTNPRNVSCPNSEVFVIWLIKYRT